MRLVATATTETVASTLALHGAILAHLRTHGGDSGSKIAQAIHGRKDAVLAALRDLAATGQIDSTQAGRACLWFVR